MGPVTHGLVSWWTANALPLSRRDRLLVFLAGVSPDLDGLPIVFSQELYFRWHHILCHNLAFGLGCLALVALFAQQRLRSVGLALVAFHLHLACDYFGSGGWDGQYVYIWPLPYLYPFIGSGEAADTFIGPAWYWNPWQWPLSSWINQAVSIVALAGLFYTGIRLDRTWFELVTPGFDKQFCQTLRKWFGGKVADNEADPIRFVRRTLALLCVVATWACVLAAMHADGSRFVKD